MDNLNGLYSALKSAHKAGDTENATRLKEEIERQKAVAELYKINSKSQAIANLTFGNPYPKKTKVGKPPPSIPVMGVQPIPVKKTPLTTLTPQQWYKNFYEHNLSVILQDDNAGFNFEEGLSDEPKRIDPVSSKPKDGFFAKMLTDFASAPEYSPTTGIAPSSVNPRAEISDRAAYGMMPTRATQMAWLRQEFGEENVKFYQTPNHDLFLWRRNKEDSWKMPEPLETIDFADFSSDLAGEIIPTVTSTAGGLLAIPSGPLGVSIGAGLGQGVGRAGQEYLIEKTLLGEADVNRIMTKASIEAVLTTGVDFGFQYVPNLFFRSILGREGTDIFAEEMTRYNLIASQRQGEGVYTPQFLQQGGDVAQNTLRIESRFPDRTISRELDIKRTQAGETFEGIFNPAGTDQALNDEAFRGTLERIKNNLRAQRQEMQNRLNALKQEEDLIKARSGDTKSLKIQAEEEALKIFNEQIKLYERNVLASRNVSPAEAGNSLRNDLANMFADVDVAKSRMFEEAYEGLTGVSAPLEDLQAVFSRHSNELLNDVEFDALQILNANARKTSQGVIRSLDQLQFNDGSIDFKSLNEIIQKIEEKTRRGNFAKGFEANQYTALANDLRTLRTEMLDTADPIAKERFNNANAYFKDTYLRYIGGDIGSMLKARKGSSYNDALAARKSPVEFQVTNDVNPNYVKGSGDRRIRGYKVKTKDGNDYYIEPDPNNPDPQFRFKVYPQDRNGNPNLDELVATYRTKTDAVNSLEQIEPPDIGTFLPDFDTQDDVITGMILKNSGTAQDFLELSGNNAQTRNLLRDAWLQSKGLYAGEPINLDRILKMSPVDMDMVRVLYPEGQRPSPQAGVAGWNDKVALFEKLKKVAKDKDKNIAKISSQTFDRIFKTNSKRELAELERIAIQEGEVAEEMAKQSQTMVKMATEGRIPLPKNRVEMTTFLEGVMRSTPEEQRKFVALFGTDPDSPALLELQGAVFHELVRRTKVQGKLVTPASPKDNVLWDPFVMADELESSKELLLALLGREAYANVVTSNKVLMNLTRPTLDEAGKQMVPRVAATGGGLRIWFGNVAAPVTDRLGSMVLTMQSRFPITKQVISAKQYDKYQNALLKTILLGRRGHELMDSEVQDSPEMMKFVQDQLQGIKDEANLLRPEAFPDPIEVQ
jgi:hypothetical protein